MTQSDTTTQPAHNHAITKTYKIAIVRTSYHARYNDNLEHACRATLTKNGVLPQNITTVVAPGSWEIPLCVQTLARKNTYDAIIAFGIIIKGDTLHFELIAQEVSRSLMDISLAYHIPVVHEVLALYNTTQADVRAGDAEVNKGVEGANAALQMISLLSSTA